METTWDLVENRIKIETRFRLDVTDYINKMYKTRENSILPYDINTGDVFEMLQNLTWTFDDKFVVFFNFEFVMCLMKLGVTPNRITYVAPSKESFYAVRDGGWGERGMKSILFDLSIYKRYQNKKQWKSHLMKKIGKLDEFIVVGNIPFTINDSESDNSVKIGDEFVKLINSSAKKYCYILRWKSDSTTFRKKIILDDRLSKIVFHKKAIFDIHDNIKTCHIVGDSIPHDKFVFKDNVSDKFIKLNKVPNLVLSNNIIDSYEIDTSKKNLGDFWTRGTKYLKDIDLNKKEGKYKVIYSLGNWKDDSFNYTFDDFENSTLGKWKIILPLNGGGRAINIAGPEYSVIYNVIALQFDNENDCKKVYEWAKKISLTDILNKLRTSGQNNKVLLSKITLPDGLI
jgi:hypothetical protein